MDTNVLGNVHLIDLFMPLEGLVKKVTMISSAMADTELVNKYELNVSPIYALSKVTLDMSCEIQC
jgi:hypothetical protein